MTNSIVYQWSLTFSLYCYVVVMSNKIYLFTGEEQYLLHQELQRRKERFVLKHGRE